MCDDIVSLILRDESFGDMDGYVIHTSTVTPSLLRRIGIIISSPSLSSLAPSSSSSPSSSSPSSSSLPALVTGAVTGVTAPLSFLLKLLFQVFRFQIPTAFFARMSWSCFLIAFKCFFFISDSCSTCIEEAKISKWGSSRGNEGYTVTHLLDPKFLAR